MGSRKDKKFLTSRKNNARYKTRKNFKLCIHLYLTILTIRNRAVSKVLPVDSLRAVKIYSIFAETHA